MPLEVDDDDDDDDGKSFIFSPFCPKLTNKKTRESDSKSSYELASFKMVVRDGNPPILQKIFNSRVKLFKEVSR